jgi:integrase
MEYHVFRKPKKLKNGKTARRWYYYYLDGDKKQVQKACKGCKTRKEAEYYIRALPGPSAPAGRVRIEDIARDMFLDGSAHMNRRIQLGRKPDLHTQLEARHYIRLIIEKWGRMTLAELNPADVTKHLFAVNRSGSWKNRYTCIFGEIYAESQWYGCRAERPRFQRFAKNTRKADIFTTGELDRLFVPANFPSHEFYVFFLLCVSGGLRLGEIRAVRPKQFVFERKALIVDGFCKRNGERTNYNKTGSPANPRFRIVLLPDITLEKMKAHIEGNGIADNDFCFKADGLPVRQSLAESVFATALIKSGIAVSRSAFKKTAAYKLGGTVTKSNIIPDGRRLVVHSLRYTYVTRMRRELPAEIVMKMVGHTAERQTDYYTDRRSVDEALAAIEDAAGAAERFFI